MQKRSRRRNASGAPFRGRFIRCKGDVRVDAARSRIGATIETSSAVDGVPLHDQTIPEAEWFDVAHYPTARFNATSIKPRDGTHYEVVETLTLKGKDIPITPP